MLWVWAFIHSQTLLHPVIRNAIIVFEPAVTRDVTLRNLAQARAPSLRLFPVAKVGFHTLPPAIPEIPTKLRTQSPCSPKPTPTMRHTEQGCLQPSRTAPYPGMPNHRKIASFPPLSASKTYGQCSIFPPSCLHPESSDTIVVSSECCTGSGRLWSPGRETR